MGSRAGGRSFRCNGVMDAASGGRSNIGRQLRPHSPGPGLVGRKPAKRSYLGASGPISQAAYQSFVDSIVAYCNANNIYCDIDLQCPATGPRARLSNNTQCRTTTVWFFWQNVAARYANNPSVLFDTFNEPYPPPGPPG